MQFLLSLVACFDAVNEPNILNCFLLSIKFLHCHELFTFNDLHIYFQNSQNFQWNCETIEKVCVCLFVVVVVKACYGDQNHDVNDQNMNIAAKTAYDMVK